MSHTAANISARKRQAIAFALADGQSQRFIARKLKTSEHIVAIVSHEDWQQVASHKTRLAAQAERNALLAGEQIAEALEQRKFPIGSLVPVYGVSIDKSLTLRGESVATIQHLHTHRMSQDDVYAFALERSKHVTNAHVIENDNSVTLPALQDRNHDNTVMSDPSPQTHLNPDARARKKRRRRAVSADSSLRRPVSADSSLRKKSE